MLLFCLLRLPDSPGFSLCVCWIPLYRLQISIAHSVGLKFSYQAILASVLKDEIGTLVSALLLLLSRFSCVRLLVTPWTAAHQAPPSMGFSRQEYWSGVPLPNKLQDSAQQMTLQFLESCSEIKVNRFS